MNKTIKKYLYLALGFITTGLGIVGVFLPLMPTTCFLIVAVWAFSKSNPALGERILHDPRFGPTIKNWMENKSINKKSKCTISISIVVAFSITFLVMNPSLILSAFLISGMLMLLFYINTRPENNEAQTEINLSNQKAIN